MFAEADENYIPHQKMLCNDFEKRLTLQNFRTHTFNFHRNNKGQMDYVGLRNEENKKEKSEKRKRSTSPQFNNPKIRNKIEGST